MSKAAVFSVGVMDSLDGTVDGATGDTVVTGEL